MSEMKKYRIEMTTNSVLLSEVFPRFVASKIAEGVSEKTENTYYSHWKCIGKHLDLNKTFDEITQDDINNVVVSMRRDRYESVDQGRPKPRNQGNWRCADLRRF